MSPSCTALFRCDDIDECSQSPPPCDQLCHNTFGSYQCRYCAVTMPLTHFLFAKESKGVTIFCPLYIHLLQPLGALLYLTVLYSPGALLATNSTGTAEPAGTWTSALLARYRDVHVGVWHYHMSHDTVLHYGVFKYGVF